MLHIDRGIHIDPGFQQFFDILISFEVTAARSIGMGQFIHQNQLRLTLQRAIQIQFLQMNPFVFQFQRRQQFQTGKQIHRLRAGMRFDISSNHICPLLQDGMRRFQHRIGFADTGGIAEKDF